MRIGSRTRTTTLCRLEGVVKTYGSRNVLDGMDLAVHGGEVVVLLGRNGAGKTTCIDIALGLRQADAGHASLLGTSPRSTSVRRRVGAVAQEADFPARLNPTEVLELVSAHYPRPLEVVSLLERFGLHDVARRACGRLSGGQKRRLATACAVVGDPELAVLDEPGAALDVEGRQSLWDTVRLVADGDRGVLLTTHDMEEAEELADRIVVIHHGAAVAQGSARQLRQASLSRRVVLHPPPDGPLPELPEVPAGRVVSRTQDRIVVLTPDVDRIRQVAQDTGISGRQIEVTTPSLRETFVELTGETS
ncbi:ABC transporter ATP-binding protein [Pseudokineococcus sp. 1T1Z-3]|uniref:ABC transporter ATP-binding protein n=1 Tax=Pseudokineococcus sp. 1T1Z-3 TaxID=3132745 RepID=UPI0030A56AB1